MLRESTEYNKRTIVYQTEPDSALEPVRQLTNMNTKSTEGRLLHHLCMNILLIGRDYYVTYDYCLLWYRKYVWEAILTHSYYLLAIHLMINAAVKYYIWNSKYEFCAFDFNIRNALFKYWKGLLIDMMNNHTEYENNVMHLQRNLNAFSAPGAATATWGTLLVRKAPLVLSRNAALTVPPLLP